MLVSCPIVCPFSRIVFLFLFNVAWMRYKNALNAVFGGKVKHARDLNRATAIQSRFKIKSWKRSLFSYVQAVFRIKDLNEPTRIEIANWNERIKGKKLQSLSANLYVAIDSFASCRFCHISASLHCKFPFPQLKYNFALVTLVIRSLCVFV